MVDKLDNKIKENPIGLQEWEADTITNDHFVQILVDKIFKRVEEVTAKHNENSNKINEIIDNLPPP